MSGWLAETLLATTLLMAVVMALRAPVRRLFGARVAYALWALPLLRAVLPPLPQKMTAAAVLPQDFVPAHAVDLAHSAFAPVAMFAPSAALTRSATSTPFPWLECVIALWMAGAALFLIVQLTAYFRFRSQLLLDGTEQGREGRVRIVATAAAPGPLAFGVLHPHVVLPADFASRYTDEECELALAHELTHHRRGDLAANLAALGLMALHWCNPIAWIAYRAFRTDQELACDAQVLRDHGRDRAEAYGRAIVKAAAGGRFGVACHLNGIVVLKGRLKMLSTHSESLHRITIGMATVGGAALLGLFLTASGSRAAQEIAAVSGKVAQADLKKLTGLMQPARPDQTPQLQMTPAVPRAPAAPAAPVAPQPATAAMPSDIPSPPAPLAPLAPPVPSWDRMDSPSSFVPDVPAIPDVARMVPRVTVIRDCDDPISSTRESVGSDGRHHITVKVCQRAIQRQARAEAARGVALARAEIAAARAEVAADRDMESALRAKILAKFDSKQAELARKQAELDRRQAEREADDH